ncbi:MAG: hypothetical protein WA988_06925 [Candidatus Nanopelagicales bacterium]
MWERPFATGSRGRPPAVDICLFDDANGIETRVEFGEFSPNKLKSDANKLNDLTGDALEEYPSVASFIVLWDIRKVKMTVKQRRERMRAFVDAAEKVRPATVSLLSVSGGDLFTSTQSRHHWVAAGLFKVQESAQLKARS